MKQLQFRSLQLLELLQREKWTQCFMPIFTSIGNSNSSDTVAILPSDDNTDALNNVETTSSKL